MNARSLIPIWNAGLVVSSAAILCVFFLGHEPDVKTASPILISVDTSDAFINDVTDIPHWQCGQQELSAEETVAKAKVIDVVRASGRDPSLFSIRVSQNIAHAPPTRYVTVLVGGQCNTIQSKAAAPYVVDRATTQVREPGWVQKAYGDIRWLRAGRGWERQKVYSEATPAPAHLNMRR